MTGSAMRPSTAAWPAARAPVASAARRVRAISPPPSPTCSTISSAISWAGSSAAAVAQRASRGSDLRYNLKISLEDAYSGLQKQINVPTPSPAGPATGTGSEGGSEPVTCPTCSGMGKVRAQQGFFTVERTCPTCSGVGQIVKNPCKTCGGAGRVQKDRALNVNIPAGVETGTRIRLSGRGRGRPARRSGGRSLHLHRGG
jgi:DnaJ-class molecular chaperone